ncbi:hypothetical protein EQU24_13420 [Methylotuvimicrobium buryatense]|uniref:Uncharacterized protein n=1 Tax=Methylotuvimicrobium buryatense TaxID=95641 RepID=A0A4P9URE9_METBY|nr:hypothetical protein EQU24_13420 [Methylotuvimicrobium buryatense]
MPVAIDSRCRRESIPFALQISAVSKEAPGCAAPHLTLGEGPAWSWHRAYRDVSRRPLTGNPCAEL